MAIAAALAFALLRLAGFFTEPRLDSADIHAIAGEPSRVMWPLADDRPLRVVTWNIERGERYDLVESLLDTLDVDVVLLQEVDRSCGRSEFRNVAQSLAAYLRMNWVAAGEFQEIGEGAGGRPCVSGQAILSRVAIDDARVIVFEDQAELKWRLNPLQPRRGARVALRASIGGVTYYNVHLESGGNEQRRANQLRDVLSDAETIAQPLVVGGDFNNEGDLQSPVFSGLLAAGFRNPTSADTAVLNLARRPIDWLFIKGVEGDAEPLPAPDASDHDPVILEMWPDATRARDGVAARTIVNGSGQVSWRRRTY